MNRLTRRVAALLMAAVLALAAGVGSVGLAPLPLLAAPPAQATAVVGYYESELLAAADTAGVVYGLTLFNDGTAEVTSDYQNDEAPILEFGTWADNGDGTLTLTLTGTAEQDYAEPVALVFNLDESGALVIPGEEGGLFGTEGLVLAPADAAGDDAGDDAADDSTDEPAADEPGEAVPYVDETLLATLPADSLVYQSEILPAASSPGLQLTLILYSDGTMEMVSDYLDEEVVLELGTWNLADDGAIVLTITGQLERDYDAPVELSFTDEDDGSLVLVDEGGALFGDAGLTLLPVSVGDDAATDDAVDEAATDDTATDDPGTDDAAEDDADDAAATDDAADDDAADDDVAIEATDDITDEIDSDVAGADVISESVAVTATNIISESVAAVAPTTPVGPYVSAVLPDADTGGTFLVALFYEDGDVLVSTYFLNGQTPINEVGTWADNGDTTYTITATGTLDEEYDEPVTVEISMADDGTLLLNRTVLYPVPGVDPAMLVAEIIAQFQSDILPAASSPGLQVTLSLYDDFTVEMVSDYQDETDPVVEIGMWDVAVDSSLQVTLTGQPDVLYEVPVILGFTLDDDGILTLNNDPGNLYGEAGLTMTPTFVDEAVLEDEAVEDGTGESALEDEATADDTAEDTAEDDTATDDATDGAAADEDAADDATADDATAEPTETPAAEETPAADEEADDAATDDAAADDTTTDDEAAATDGILVYQSDVLPSASSPGLQITLALVDDGTAVMDYDYQNDGEVVSNVGTWEDNGDGTLTLTLTAGPNGDFVEPTELTLSEDAEGALTIVDASEESIGLVDTALAPVTLE